MGLEILHNYNERELTLFAVFGHGYTSGAQRELKYKDSSQTDILVLSVLPRCDELLRLVNHQHYVRQ